MEVDEKTVSSETCDSENQSWVTCGGYSLSLYDLKSLRNRDDLNSMHINFGQTLIKE